jgi:hypothetical protein
MVHQGPPHARRIRALRKQAGFTPSRLANTGTNIGTNTGTNTGTNIGTNTGTDDGGWRHGAPPPRGALHSNVQE